MLRAILNRFSSTFLQERRQSSHRPTCNFRNSRPDSLSSPVLSIGVRTFSWSHHVHVGPTWFVPILWASVSVTTYLAGEFTTSLLFGLLTVALAGVLFFVAVGARSKYWVPMPPSITITSAVYAPRDRICFNDLECEGLAIARKDLRGLVRRREMLRLLATPFVFLVISFLTQAVAGRVYSLHRLFHREVVRPHYFHVGNRRRRESDHQPVFDSFASKGLRDWESRYSGRFSSLSAVLIYVLLAVVDRTVAFQALTFVVVAVGIALEMSLLGLLLGVRYPNFSEGPRSAFVSQTGDLLGMAVAAIVGGISVAPLLIASILGLDSLYIAVGVAASIAFILVGPFVFYRLAEHQATKLLSQLPN